VHPTTKRGHLRRWPRELPPVRTEPGGACWTIQPGQARSSRPNPRMDLVFTRRKIQSLPAFRLNVLRNWQRYTLTRGELRHVRADVATCLQAAETACETAAAGLYYPEHLAFLAGADQCEHRMQLGCILEEKVFMCCATPPTEYASSNLIRLGTGTSIQHERRGPVATPEQSRTHARSASRNI
jgi:hypothetical protein